MVQFAPPVPPKAPALNPREALEKSVKPETQELLSETRKDVSAQRADVESNITPEPAERQKTPLREGRTIPPLETQETEPAETRPVGLYDDNFAAAFGLPPSLLKPKMMGGIFAGIFLFGMLFGALLFGGSSQPQQTGLQGVIANPDIKTKLPRCGRTDNSSACVLYIVNHSTNDKRARDFFDSAVKLTGRQRYAIEIDNPAYANTRIPAGYFAQIKIPSLR